MDMAALVAMDKEYAVAEKKTMTWQRWLRIFQVASANILAQVPNYDEATRQFDRSFQLIQSSSLSQDIKANATLLHEYNMAGIAIAKKDYATAKAHAAECAKAAEASKNLVQVQQAHELAGRIAFAEKDNDSAIAELQQANLRGDPRNLYRLPSLAYREGQAVTTAKAQEFLTKAAAIQFAARLCLTTPLSGREGAEAGGRQESSL